VNENAKEELLCARVVGAGTESGPQLAFVLGEGSFGMDPVLVDVLGESALQLATVPGLRPFPRATSVDGSDQGADADVPTELMVGFAVVGHVGEDAIPVDSKRAIQDRRSELGGVVARPLADRGGHPEVAGGVSQDGQLGEGGSQKRLRVGSFVPIVRADVAGFVARGVDRPLGLEINQATAAGSITD
jgi:hypothetical protein